MTNNDPNIPDPRIVLEALKRDGSG
jgi:hypothetical protein